MSDMVFIGFCKETPCTLCTYMYAYYTFPGKKKKCVNISTDE